MSRKPIDLESLSIRRPCPKRWEELIGDDRKRFCETCSLHVHDVSAMKRAEAQDFLAGKRGRVCLTFSRDTEGRLRTTDEARERATRRAPRFLSRPWATAASFVFGLLSFLPSCAPRNKADSEGALGCAPPAEDNPAPTDLSVLREIGYVALGEVEIE